MRPSKEERLQYNVDYPKDTDYAAYARLLQSKWRQSKGYVAGKLGNYIETEFAKNTKANFVTERIGNLVSEQIADARLTGALIGQPRIWDNLLSSQPLCFNLFGELHYDLELATRYFQALFPNSIDRVTSIKFEYSPGRGSIDYLHDHSAFDVFVEYEWEEKLCFMGIEVKYAESLKEETAVKANKQFKKRYAEVTESWGIFRDNSIDELKLPPYSQIWRDHLLAISILKHPNNRYHKGRFIFLSPAKNQNCISVANEYKKYLGQTAEALESYSVMHLETFIEMLVSTTDSTWAKDVQSRYLGI